MQGAAYVPFFSKNKVFFAQKSSVQAKKLNFSHRIRQKPFTEDEMLTLILSLIFHIYHAILGIDAPNKFPPPLSPEEESAAFEKARAGDEKARERLILHNLRLVSHIVRKYYGAHRDAEDLVSIGTIGLVKAVDTFKTESGTRFATYGARCIQNEILMYFRAQKKRAGDVSLGETIDVDRDGNPLTYMDVISTTEDPGEEFDKKERIRRALNIVKCRLDERERQIIVMRYGLLGLTRSFTQKEIAEKLGISRSYVSRIEKSALEKLKDALK